MAKIPLDLWGVSDRAGRKVTNKERLHNELVWIKELRDTPSHEQRRTIFNWQSMIGPECY